MFGADDSAVGSNAGDFKRGLEIELDGDDSTFGWLGEASFEGRFFFPMLGK